MNGRAIDFAKLGWLHLHDGRRGSLQVVPEDFIETATRADSIGDPADFYQYLWWVEVEEAAFERLGVFTYSRELDTPMGQADDQVPEPVKEERRERFMMLQAEISREKLAARVGQGSTE